ncbi:hypothetical protein CDV31_013492 [Fusarium ambrosium]|uniref:Helicase C-terminal domain-containing protein n=1 Tax=Fusarium ambrosium TaxID=131363 RepID=A0A428T2Y3_9HYPO|nr:hypothetical protein CDV31_013492 [Fusarium ambrosium]
MPRNWRRHYQHLQQRDTTLDVIRSHAADEFQFGDHNPNIIIESSFVPGLFHSSNGQFPDENANVGNQPPGTKSNRAPAPRVDETNLIIRGEPVNLLQYLDSPSFAHHLATFSSPYREPCQPMPFLQTALKPWQWVGVNKLKLAAHSDFRGCILSDAVGLGKSLTALVAALELREELPVGHPRRGPVLVVCRSGCVSQWAGELTRHWKREHRPTFLILDHRAYPHDALRVYDLVICSHSFVRGLLRDKDVAAYQHRIAYASGMASAVGRLKMRVKPPSSSRSMGNPLNPGIAGLRETGFSALIFDESQDAKNEGTYMNHAVRDLRYEYAFMLTATPFHNAWTDISGQLRLLPQGGPFKDLKHFLNIFETRGDLELVTHPRDGRKALFDTLMAATVLSRPKDCVNLPPVHRKTVTVDLTGHWRTVLLISCFTQRARSLLATRQDGNKDDNGGFAMLTWAAALAAHPIIVTYQHADVLEDVADNIDAAFRKFARANGLPLEGGVDSLTLEHFHEFGPHWKAWARKHDQPSGQIPSTQGPAQIQTQFHGSGSSRLAAMTTFERYIHQHDDEEDPLRPSRQGVDVNDAGDIQECGSEGELSDREPDVGKPRKAKKKAKTASKTSQADDQARGRRCDKWTEDWIKELNRLDDFTRDSPRVKAIVEEVGTTLNNFPEDKIIVASNSVMFLDIIKQAILRQQSTASRNTYNVGILEYNSTVGKPDDRGDSIHRFNDPNSPYRILLLSSEAGGTGLNIAGANHLILAEPCWSPGLDDQIQGRLHRMPQHKPVYITDITAPLSAIDNFKFQTVEGKLRFLGTNNAGTRRTDDASFQIPALPTERDLGWSPLMIDMTED